MANWDSDQIAAAGGIPGLYGDGNSGGVYAPLDTSKLGGRLRVAYFTWTVPAGSVVATGDVLFACQLPATATLLLGKLWANNSSFAATAVQVGFYDTVAADAYAISGVGGVSLATTTEVVLCNTFATQQLIVPGQTPAPNTPFTSNTNQGQPYPYLLEMCAVILTFTGTAPASGYKLAGMFQYVLD